MPTSHNVERIIRDFSNGRQQYAAAHLFFIEGIASVLKSDSRGSSLAERAVSTIARNADSFSR
jgi:hypothetical protein